MSTTYQGIFIINNENKIYMQIEECGENNYEVQISNENNLTVDDYILDENNKNKTFKNGKDAFEYVVKKYFEKPIKHLQTTGTYFVSEEELKAISKSEIIEII